MPSKPPRVCSHCGDTVRGRCPCQRDERRTTDRARGSAAERGYGRRWQQVIRPQYLAAHPHCVQCGQPSSVPDHHPIPRRRLVAMGVPDPDDWRWLRALCKPCHDKHTARTTPGGWNRREVP